MIVVTIDGLNWRAAKEIFPKTFPEQSMKMIRCSVRPLTDPYGFNATPPGLVTLWSGESTKNLHSNIFRKSFELNTPIDFLDKDNTPLDLVWHHFKRGKLYEKVIGPNPYHNNEEYWKHYQHLKEIGVRFVPSEELCIFSEAHKEDYDLFWIHSSIVKGAVFFPGPYEHGRIPSLRPYDEIRKDKALKKEVFMMGVRRYREVLRYLADIRPDQTIVLCSDHGTLVDLPFTEDQIDEIPILVNRDIDLSDINYQWDVKKLLLRL